MSILETNQERLDEIIKPSLLQSFKLVGNQGAGEVKGLGW